LCLHDPFRVEISEERKTQGLENPGLSCETPLGFSEASPLEFSEGAGWGARVLKRDVVVGVGLVVEVGVVGAFGGTLFGRGASTTSATTGWGRSIQFGNLPGIEIYVVAIVILVATHVEIDFHRITNGKVLKLSGPVLDALEFDHLGKLPILDLDHELPLGESTGESLRFHDHFYFSFELKSAGHGESSASIQGLGNGRGERKSSQCGLLDLRDERLEGRVVDFGVVAAVDRDFLPGGEDLPTVGGVDRRP